MAMELCSSDECSIIMSPARISFSHDISQTDSVPIEQHIRTTSSSSSIDFDFCVFRETFTDLESSSADELFFDGKILPIEIKRRINYISPSPTKKIEQQQQQPLPPPPPCKNNSIIECEPDNKTEAILEDQKQNTSKSFWRFKRSSSLNCGNGYARTLCPLPLLSRSNSTGSSPSVKRNNNSSLQKDNLGHHHKQQQHSHRSNSAKSSMSNSSNGHNYQKPPLKKGNPYNNGVRINSVLNVPPASLFGLSSFFSSGKEKNKKK